MKALIKCTVHDVKSIRHTRPGPQTLHMTLASEESPVTYENERLNPYETIRWHIKTRTPRILQQAFEPHGDEVVIFA